jgi:hypothetical protein
VLSRSSTARVRCPKNEALSNSIPVTAVTSFESRQVQRSSQICTPVPLHPGCRSGPRRKWPQTTGAAPVRPRASYDGSDEQMFGAK